MKTEVSNSEERKFKKVGTEKIDEFLINYEIEIETGKRSYSGTDANVYIKLYGENNKHTELIKIGKNSSNDFEKGTITRENIKCKDIGKISRIYVEHDNTGARAGWFLEKVKVNSSYDTSTFEVKEWLSNKDKNIHPSTTAIEDSMKIKHIIIIETGEKESSGTDAGVYIQLYGDNGKVTTLQGVDTLGHNDFEKGGLGAYIVYSNEDLGNINKIRVEHDNTGNNPWWYIKRILIDNIFSFTIEDWIGTNEPDVYPSKIYSRDIIESNNSVLSEVENSDSNDKWFELNFDKTKQVRITTGDTSETIRLYDKGIPYSLWGRGGSYIGCGIDAAHSYMGWFNKNITRSDIKKYVETHAAENNTWEILQEGWEWVTEVFTGGLSSYFDHDFEWNDKIFSSPAEVANGLENLMKNKSSVADYKIIKYSINNKEYKAENIDYKSDEEVNIAIIKTIKAHLEKGTPLIALVTNGAHWVTIVGIKVGYTDSSKNHISIDNTSISYINMTIGGTRENRAYKYMEIYGWAEDAAAYIYPSYVEGTLITLKNDLILEPSVKIDPQYIVSITTGDAKNAGTNSSIFVTLYGEYGESHEVKVDSICDDYERPFKHNQYQKVVGLIKTDKYLGKIYRIKVRSDGIGEKSGWLLKNVTVEREINNVNEVYEFTGGTWFEKDTRLEKFIEENAYRSKYKISLKTGDVQYAGTNSAIYIQIFGELGTMVPFNSELVYVDNPDEDDNERNTISVHYIYAPKEMLDIEKVYVESDCRGNNSGWFLEKVTVEKIDQESNEKKEKVLGTYNFTVDKWLKSISPSVTAFEDLIKENYNIKVKTGDVRWAGTGASVYIKLYGDRITDFIKLNNFPYEQFGLDNGTFSNVIGSYNFKRGNIDEFKITNINIGDLEKIEIKHDNTGDNPGWFLEKVEVTKQSNQYNFTAQRWLSEDHGLSVNAIINEDLNQSKYIVTIKTANKKGAGTDSNIYIKLFGEYETETSLQRMNDPDVNDFEQNQISFYTIYSTGFLGEINKIYIESDCAGDYADWELESVSISLESDRNTKYIFNETYVFDKNNKYKYFYRN
jgi:hypothetical protein